MFCSADVVAGVCSAGEQAAMPSATTILAVARLKIFFIVDPVSYYRVAKQGTCQVYGFSLWHASISS
jgi:hypothetical protein